MGRQVRSERGPNHLRKQPSRHHEHVLRHQEAQRRGRRQHGDADARRALLHEAQPPRYVQRERH